jgi:hypothetical protein
MKRIIESFRVRAGVHEALRLLLSGCDEAADLVIKGLFTRRWEVADRGT